MKLIIENANYLKSKLSIEDVEVKETSNYVRGRLPIPFKPVIVLY